MSVSITYPLTVKSLEGLLKSIVAEVNKSFEISESLLKTLYSKSVNSTVTSTIGATTFTNIVNAINDGKTLKCTNGTISIVAGTYTSIPSDSYESFEICVIGALDGSTLEKVVFGVENLDGAMRLYEKTVADV